MLVMPHKWAKSMLAFPPHTSQLADPGRPAYRVIHCPWPALSAPPHANQVQAKQTKYKISLHEPLLPSQVARMQLRPLR
jgi:hypothetical protein